MLTDRQIEIIKEMQSKAKTNAEIAKRLKTTIHYYRRNLSIAYELGKVSEEVYKYSSKSKVTEVRRAKVSKLIDKMTAEEIAKKLGVAPVTIKKDIKSFNGIEKEKTETNEKVEKLFVKAQKRKAKPYNYFTEKAPPTIEPKLNINSKYVKVTARNMRGQAGRSRELEVLQEYQHHILFKDRRTGRKESFNKAELLVMQTENRIKEIRHSE